tara:strand:- start:1172 stop:1342 length:171 start_codon:yes stop_codon:yes gene_type:complete
MRKRQHDEWREELKGFKMGFVRLVYGGSNCRARVNHVLDVAAIRTWDYWTEINLYP